MYINDLGYERTGRVIDNGNTVRTTGAINNRKRSSYATAMQKAVDNQKSSVTPTFATAGDIIIKEAFDKMKTDPEWEETVMNKVKEYYAGNSATAGAQTSYLNYLAQNSMQNYMLQSMLGGTGSLGLGLTGYSAYGLGNLAASAYSNMMTAGLSNSLFGSWEL